VLVSFASARGSKPRWISFGMVMLFIGCMICISPHFLRSAEKSSSTGDNQLGGGGGLASGENSIELCNKSVYFDLDGRSVYSNRTFDETTIERAKSSAGHGGGAGFFDRLFQVKNLIYVGNFVNGFSSASMTTITFSYLEDIAPPALSAVYESAYYATGAFGVRDLKLKHAR
jgi:hypothetical protein